MWEKIFKAPVASMLGGLGSFVFHCGSQRKFYVEPSSWGQVLVCNTRKTHVRSCNSPPERHSDVCPQCIFKILNGASKCGPS